MLGEYWGVNNWYFILENFFILSIKKGGYSRKGTVV